MFSKKFILQVQLTYTDELEILIDPEGVIPVISFLKLNQLCQFTNLSDLTAVDVPTRPYRFEVGIFYKNLNY